MFKANLGTIRSSKSLCSNPYTTTYENWESYTVLVQPQPPEQAFSQTPFTSSKDGKAKHIRYPLTHPSDTTTMTTQPRSPNCMLNHALYPIPHCQYLKQYPNGQPFCVFSLQYANCGYCIWLDRSHIALDRKVEWWGPGAG